MTTTRTVLDLFEAQADADPGRPALTHGERRWSYRELDGLAEELAAQLRTAGVRPGHLVPLLVGSGPLLPIGMLAAFKLGAAFVPIDETWPATRLAAVLGDLDCTDDGATCRGHFPPPAAGK